ncbi:phage tail fiber protein [Paractinoplanes toevensis]|uniref:Uncharacterized protein n=1 Tax=Paractinoplanes toevensis TaxID=571911 RepID=A0A919W7D5_9ACTN|nr:hypothetical protein [Actinoplanes toevensis]GIM88896.1 hypothetical protein Ato02nite_006890 [Actinoplanes toevensis]
MANNIVAAEANRLLDASWGVASYTAPTGAMKLALVSVIGSNTAAGTEVTGGSYARQTITMGSASSGANASSVACNYTNMPATTTVGVDVYDSNGSPRRAWWGALTASKTTASGDSLSFAIGAITSSII